MDTKQNQADRFDLLDENDKLRNHLIELKKELARARDCIACMIAQTCEGPHGTIDSNAITAFADAMHFLSDHGRLKITKEFGRRVIGEWTTIQT